MARSSYPTLLSLDRFAKIMNISPCHFNGVAGIQTVGGKILFPLDNAQNDIWPRFSWQSNDQSSHEDLGREIWLAEQDIAEVLGFHIAPTWIEDELHTFEHFHRPDIHGQAVDPRWGIAGLELRRGKFVASGRRAVTLIDPRATVIYTDPDGDGFKELATITVTVPAGSDVTELKIYYSGHNGEQEWELRTAKLVTLTGNTLVVLYDSWMMIEPSISEALPSDDMTPIDISTGTPLIGSVECYREYTDQTQCGVKFVALDQYGVSTLYDGYFNLLDAHSNFVMPIRAEYDTTVGAWVGKCWGEFQYAKLWYKAGYVDSHYKPRVANDLLTDTLATAVAYLAAARLPRIYYTNNNATALVDSMRTDLAVMTSGSGSKNRYIWPDLMNNPLGTKQGEYEAWKRIKKLVEKRIGVAIL